MPSIKLADVQSAAPPDAPAREWSPQQLGVFEAVEAANESLQVVAVAGSGKTTCLVEGARRMKGSIFFGAFNKKIADEIKDRTRGISGLTAGTMHSIGLRNWKSTAPDAVVEGDKLEAICEDMHVPTYLRAFTRFMVSVSKQNGWTHPVELKLLETAAEHFDARDKLPDTWNEDSDPFEYVNAVLGKSIEMSTDLIDFDDMIYMPLRYGHIESSFDWVLVDEAQDTNRVRRDLVSRLLRPGGRVVAVGDPHQAIYGFTGADADAMDLIASEFQCKYLPLTVTYRCPKRIVAHAQQWVSHIEAAPTAPEGEVIFRDADFLASATAEDFRPGDAILCRYTRPLVTQALGMIRKGIGARVEGREIGQQLLTLAARWKSATNMSKLIDRIETWRYTESKKFTDRGQQQKARGVEDKADSLIAIIQSLKPDATQYDLRNRINTLFGDTEPGQPAKVTTLSTVHKAKGREWDRVYILGREQLMPSQWAKKEWEQEQEKNLIYVAVTRAKKQLIEVEFYG